MARFQPGQSGNPGGRPKKDVCLTDLLRRALAAKGDDGQAKRKSLIDRLLSLALAGDLDAIKVILDRVDGKVVDRHEHSGPEGERLTIKVVYDRDTAASSLPPPNADAGGEGVEEV